MKQLTNTERLEVAMIILDERQVAEYAAMCEALEQDRERNGFENTPAECENWECNQCSCDDVTRRKLGCPYDISKTMQRMS